MTLVIRRHIKGARCAIWTRKDEPGAVPNRECAYCKTPIAYHAHGVRKPSKVFCGYKCQDAYKNLIRRKEPTARQCGQCGQAFTAKRTDAIYCSPRCRQRARRASSAHPQHDIEQPDKCRDDPADC